MLVVIALGGNAILKRGEPMIFENQRANVKTAAAAIAAVINAGHDVVITHGNGPQVGLLALQGLSYDEALVSPLDVLVAETEGLIGYLIEQELANLLQQGREVAALITRTEVDAQDIAFQNPTKPIGPVYAKKDAETIAARHHWTMMADGPHFRRAVPSPRPHRILEIGTIRLLLKHQVIVICGGGGGIPVVEKRPGVFVGVEAVIDKDNASALLARALNADALLLLTDVDGVYLGWGTAKQKRLPRARPAQLNTYAFADGSMGPKIQAAIDFVTGGRGFVGIGRLDDALAILNHSAGTIVTL